MGCTPGMCGRVDAVGAGPGGAADGSREGQGPAASGALRNVTETRLPISCAHGSNIALVHIYRDVLQDMPASEIIRASGLAFLWWQKVM